MDPMDWWSYVTSGPAESGPSNHVWGTVNGPTGGGSPTQGWVTGNDIAGHCPPNHAWGSVIGQAPGGPPTQGWGTVNDKAGHYPPSLLYSTAEGGPTSQGWGTENAPAGAGPPTQLWDTVNGPAGACPPTQMWSAVNDTFVTDVVNEEADLMLHGLITAFEAASPQAHPTVRTPYHTNRLPGADYLHNIINGNPRRFYKTMKMEKDVFVKLVNELVTNHGLGVPRAGDVQPAESVAMFILVLRGQLHVDIDDRYEHSGSTVNRHLHKVLDAMESLAASTITPTRDQDDPHPYLSRRPEYLYFQVRTSTTTL